MDFREFLPLVTLFLVIALAAVGGPVIRLIERSSPLVALAGIFAIVIVIALYQKSRK